MASSHAQNSLSVTGSVARNRSVKRTLPICRLMPSSFVRSSRLPPPRSKTSARSESTPGRRAPRKLASASSSPVIVRNRNPVSDSAREKNVAPFRASRAVAVATATTSRRLEAVPSQNRGVLAKACASALDRRRIEHAAPINAFPEANERRPIFDDSLAIEDQEERRIRPEIQ